MVEEFFEAEVAFIEKIRQRYSLGVILQQLDYLSIKLTNDGKYRHHSML